MKFALFGDDPIVRPLIREISTRPDCRLTHAARLGSEETEILQIAPGTRLVNDWEELLGQELAAVIVCGPAEEIGEAARQLASAGQPLVVFPQGAWDTELIYELSLARDDNGVRLIPACPLWLHPYFHETGNTLPADGEDDPRRVLHLRLEREIPLPAGTELTEATLRTFLLPDVGLMRMLGGEYHQVTAVKSSTPTGGIVMATVTLAGENLPDAVWTIRPVSSASRWRLTVSRTAGTETYQSDGNDGSRLRKRGDAEENAPSFEPGRAVLEHIERGLSDSTPRPDWTDLTRDYEVLDAVRRSFARRRTIDLHFETTSERSLFKTQMTAIGCGVLTLTLLAVIVLLFLGSVLDARNAVEIQAQKANTIFYEDEFRPNSPRLTPEGRAHWEQVEADRQDAAMTPILVERGDDERLARERREFLITLLENEGVPNARQRVEVYALEGPWLASVMRIARIVVFVPLFLFLALQLLLSIARPSQTDRKSEKNL